MPYKNIDNILNDMLQSTNKPRLVDELTPRTLYLIDKIIDYTWEAEEKNWQELDEPDNHIFLVLRELSSRLHNLDIEGKEKTR